MSVTSLGLRIRRAYTPRLILLSNPSIMTKTFEASDSLYLSQATRSRSVYPRPRTVAVNIVAFSYRPSRVHGRSRPQVQTLGCFQQRHGIRKPAECGAPVFACWFSWVVDPGSLGPWWGIRR
eukprot:902433-Prorocentrum_minimum.AAC.2